MCFAFPVVVVVFGLRPGKVAQSSKVFGRQFLAGRSIKTAASLDINVFKCATFLFYFYFFGLLSRKLLRAFS
jgi:hypothetical protein